VKKTRTDLPITEPYIQRTTGPEQGNACHQTPEVNYLDRFKIREIPGRLKSETLVCRATHPSEAAVDSSLQVAGGASISPHGKTKSTNLRSQIHLDREANSPLYNLTSPFSRCKNELLARMTNCWSQARPGPSRLRETIARSSSSAPRISASSARARPAPGVQGLWFRVQGSGFRVQGSGFMVYVLCFMV